MTMQAPWRNLVAEPVKHDHLVQVYRDERVLVEAVSLFASAAIGRREAVILIATEAHATRVERCLEDEGQQVEELKRWGQLTVLDAGEVLSRFMIDGMPDRALFKGVIREVLGAVKGNGRFGLVRAYGEMVNLLWTVNLPAAIRLEELWNEVILEHGISLFCTYSLDGEGQSERLFPPDLRTLHDHLIPLEGCA
jgi:hypothetical protein